MLPFSTIGHFFRGILCFSDVFNLKTQLYSDRLAENVMSISTSALNSWIRSFYRVGPFGDPTLGDPTLGEPALGDPTFFFFQRNVAAIKIIQIY